LKPQHLPVVIITGRPAAGKSEVIDFLKKTSVDERIRRFHIGDFEELDDFLYVWETFEIDDILSRNGKPRIWTDEKYWFKDPFIWNLYIERLSLEYRKKLARDPQYCAFAIRTS
jgi:AAA15 family ATPase/GTPase